MGKFILLAALFSLGVCGSKAMAADHCSEANGDCFTCLTDSNDSNFKSSLTDADSAKDDVLKTCHDNNKTDNDECVDNVWCDSSTVTPPDHKYCFTESASVPYKGATRSLEKSKAVALDKCKKDSRSSPAECEANLWCGNVGDPAPPMFKCQATSHNLTFYHSARNLDLTRNWVMDTCHNADHTDNSECDANTWCNDKSSTPPALILAHTESSVAGDANAAPVRFERSSFSEKWSKEQTLTDCVHDQRTTNEECQANLYWGPSNLKAPPKLLCTTLSNGQTFGHRSRNTELGSKLTISDCKKATGTEDEECDANAWCEDKGPKPIMVQCATSSGAVSSPAAGFRRTGLNVEITKKYLIQECQASLGDAQNDQADQQKLEAFKTHCKTSAVCSQIR